MISVIVPIYNAESYLAACLDSITRQSEREIEIVLVDDGSTDNSLAIAQDYASRDQRIRIYSIPHSGQSAARNKGLAESKGGYIAFVDADDRLASDWCKKMLEAIGGASYIQSEGGWNPYRRTVVWGRLYKAETIAGIRFAEGMIYEDVLFSVELWLRGGKGKIIDYHGYHYTANPDSTTSQRHPEAEQKILHALRQKAKEAPWMKKWIVWYTMIRLKIFFIKQWKSYS